MTTQRLPGSEAARHGTGDADLTVMIAAHDAFRRDLTSLARAAAAAGAGRAGADWDPDRRERVGRGWEVFKRQLHFHHTGEDRHIWPTLGERLARSESARSTLQAMEEEHSRVDPLLDAVDAAFADPAGGRLADTVGELATTLHSHLAHEERDALPLIGTALTAAEWRRVGRRLGFENGLAGSAEFFAWMLDGATDAQSAGVLSTMPPPLRLVYRVAWKPRYAKVSHW
jgi:iron-sulfur cluster repair protein YtfE (RIC family)